MVTSTSFILCLQLKSNRQLDCIAQPSASAAIGLSIDASQMSGQMEFEASLVGICKCDSLVERWKEKETTDSLRPIYSSS